MTLLEAIKSRHSVRRYIDKPIEEDLVRILQDKVKEVNAAGGLHIQLVTDEPKAFTGKMAYGTFRGVSNYFVMIGKKSDSSAQNALSERIGYYGEQLVLLAQTLGLSTCWAGLTYNNIEEAYEKGDDEKLCCMIALGYGDDPGRKHKRKTAKELSRSVVAEEATPEWFHKGVEATILAPTAINQQKFCFTYLGTNENGIGLVKAERKFSLFGYTWMDLGIAKYHFELGAGKENFVWS